MQYLYISTVTIIIIACLSMAYCNLLFSAAYISERHYVLSNQSSREGLHQFHSGSLLSLGYCSLLSHSLVSPDGSQQTIGHWTFKCEGIQYSIGRRLNIFIMEDIKNNLQRINHFVSFADLVFICYTIYDFD